MKRPAFKQILFIVTYISTIIGLHTLNLRNNYFDIHTPFYPIHHFLLLYLGICIAWIFYFIGYLFIQHVLHYEVLKIKIGGVILCCFSGLCSVQLVVQLMGYFCLLYSWLIVVLTSALLYKSYPLLVMHLNSLIRLRLKKNKWKYYWLDILLWGCIAFCSLRIFLLKVVFPSLDWDTITHYNPYYLEVINTHSILPNNVWYHFFYSKGAGAQILGILLSDLDGHKLVTYISLLFGCMALWSLLSLNKSRVIALTFILAYLGKYVPNDFYIFDKQHVMLSCMILGLLWASMFFNSGDEGLKRIFTYATALMASSTVLFVPTSSGILLPAYGIAFLFYVARKNRNDAIYYGIQTITIFLTLFALLVTNYLLSGMFEINPISPFFHWANQAKLSQWTSPYVVIWLIEGFPQDLTSFSFQIKNLRESLKTLFHLNDFQWLIPLKYILGLFTLLYFIIRKFSLVRNPQPQIKLFFSIILILLSGFVMNFAMSQPISAARLFIFTTPLLILLIASILSFLIKSLVYPEKRALCGVLLGLFVVFNVLNNDPKIIGNTLSWSKLILPFVRGNLSFMDIYQSQSLFSLDALVARRTAGLNERIIASNPMHQSSNIPGRPMEVELNYAYRDWHTMVFDNADNARKSYEYEGIKYFYFDFSQPLNGLIQFSPLFQPKTIVSNLRVVWSSHNSFLLTWRKEDEIVDEFVTEEKFAQLLTKNTQANIGGKSIYAKVKAHWVRDAQTKPLSGRVDRN